MSTNPEEKKMSSRRFELHRDTDVTGVSGTGVVADGVMFPDGVVSLRWRGEWPTSVVFHDKGLEAVEAIHGHGGSTRVVWLDSAGDEPTGYVYRPAITGEFVTEEFALSNPDTTVRDEIPPS